LTVTIPAGTQPGTVLPLRGKGLSDFGCERRGDLYVAMQVQIPERMSREERDLYERFGHCQARQRS
jgi:molecular chaperone DnaJ